MAVVLDTYAPRAAGCPRRGLGGDAPGEFPLSRAHTSDPTRARSFAAFSVSLLVVGRLYGA